MDFIAPPDADQQNLNSNPYVSGQLPEVAPQVQGYVPVQQPQVLQPQVQQSYQSQPQQAQQPQQQQPQVIYVQQSVPDSKQDNKDSCCACLMGACACLACFNQLCFALRNCMWCLSCCF